jgi:hypothetical protein
MFDENIKQKFQRINRLKLFLINSKELRSPKLIFWAVRLAILIQI